MRRKGLAIAIAAVVASAGTAQAGFFEMLFGIRKPAPVVEPQHPAVTISPSRPVRKAARRPVGLDPKQTLARTIDPVKNPDWYLVDPTLKRGDILVLPGKVVVFDGRKLGDERSYAPLSQTRLISNAERTRIAKSIGR
jgi:hypothetical protein